MNFMKSLGIMKKYETCLKCGSDVIGNGAGTLLIEETFKRTCNCGWTIEVNENDEQVDQY